MESDTASLRIRNSGFVSWHAPTLVTRDTPFTLSERQHFPDPWNNAFTLISKIFLKYSIITKWTSHCTTGIWSVCNSSGRICVINYFFSIYVRGYKWPKMHCLPPAASIFKSTVLFTMITYMLVPDALNKLQMRVGILNVWSIFLFCLSLFGAGVKCDVIMQREMMISSAF